MTKHHLALGAAALAALALTVACARAEPAPAPTPIVRIVEVVVTATPVPATETPVPPPPTATPVPPTATPVPPTPTTVPPTATPVPPTATPVPPTATPVPPTATPVPPTPTPARLGMVAYAGQMLPRMVAAMNAIDDLQTAVNSGSVARTRAVIPRLREAGRQLRTVDVDGADPEVVRMDNELSAAGRDLQAMSDLMDRCLSGVCPQSTLDQLLATGRSAADHFERANAIAKPYANRV